MDTAFLGRRVGCQTLNLAPHRKSRKRSPNYANPKTSCNPNISKGRRRRRGTGGLQSNQQNINPRRNLLQSQSQSMVTKVPAKNFVMGEVKILKRGESLSSPAKTNDRVLRENRQLGVNDDKDVDLVLGSTERMGPDPETVKKHVKVEELNKVVDGVYAGYAFFASPPPSSLPVPGFLEKNGK